MTDTRTLCDQLAAWHRDRGDEWAAGHIDRMNHAERIRLASMIRAAEVLSTDVTSDIPTPSTPLRTTVTPLIHTATNTPVDKNRSYTPVIPQGHGRTINGRSPRKVA